jgi:hypothetical protein
MHQTMAPQQEAAQTIPAYVQGRWPDAGTLGFVAMTQPDRVPSPLRRPAAAAALVALVVVALLYLAISAIFRWCILLTSVISLGVLVRRMVHPVPTWVSSCQYTDDRSRTSGTSVAP